MKWSLHQNSHAPNTFLCNKWLLHQNPLHTWGICTIISILFSCNMALHHKYYTYKAWPCIRIRTPTSELFKFLCLRPCFALVSSHTFLWSSICHFICIRNVLTSPENFKTLKCLLLQLMVLTEAKMTVIPILWFTTSNGS